MQSSLNVVILNPHDDGINFMSLHFLQPREIEADLAALQLQAVAENQQRRTPTALVNAYANESSTSCHFIHCRVPS